MPRPKSPSRRAAIPAEAKTKIKRSAPTAKKSVVPRTASFHLPATVTHPELLSDGHDEAFREMLYMMVLCLGRLLSCREAFGRSLDLTGSQFAVLIGTAYQQQENGVTIRTLADHVMLAPTHVTTEVGRLIRKGLLVKRPNEEDGRSVLVSLSPRGEASLLELTPFLRRVNDLLFENVSRNSFEQISKFFRTFSHNTENALEEIRRSEATRRAGKA